MDISQNIKEVISEMIRNKLSSVTIIAGEWRLLEDLRLSLKQIFPKEKFLDSEEKTIVWIKKFLSRDDIRINSKFENRKTGKTAIAYIIPTCQEKNGENDKETQGCSKPSLKRREPGPRTSGTVDSPKKNNSEKSELRSFAFFPDFEGMLMRLGSMAQKEAWTFGSSEDSLNFHILRTYLFRVFSRLKYEDETLGYKNKIVVADCVNKRPDGTMENKKMCAFNTGLLSKSGKYIYLLFEENKRPDAQPWRFKYVCDDVRSQNFLPFKGMLPQPADFYKSLTQSTVIYNKSVNAINIDHILSTHCERLPIAFLKKYFSDFFAEGVELNTASDWDKFKDYIKNPSHKYEYTDASRKLQDCVDDAQIKARSGDSYRVNIYRPSYHSVGFFLPLYLVKPKDECDFEVGVIIDNCMGEYVARTIYQTSMAYENIRVMANQKRSWLKPERIKYWKNPYTQEEK